MEKIGNILLDYLKKNGLYEKVLQYQSLTIYNQEILKEFPALSPSYASDIHEGILKIIASNSTLSYEIFLKKQDIMERINRIFGKKIIKDIIVRVEG